MAVNQHSAIQHLRSGICLFHQRHSQLATVISQGRTMRHLALPSLITILLLSGIDRLRADDSNVHGVIERALPYIEEAGVSWIKKKECASCHRISFMVWAMDEAASDGFEIDRQKLTEWKNWSREALLSKRDEDDDLVGSRNVEGVSQILWAAQSRPVTDSEKLFTLIVSGQSDNGSWKAGGQLPSQKRPGAETIAVSTAWNALTLGLSESDAAAKSRRKAFEFLGKPIEAQSTEWFVVRLLLAIQDGNQPQIREFTELLLATQHENGGWGWLTADPSDALGTGMALYALSSVNTAPSHAARVKAISFLCSTQQPDGSWPVKGTKKTRKGKVAETATYWGTCWATIGLLSATDPALQDPGADQ